jgi:hypothetical protein
MTLKVEFLREFESLFETALDQESEILQVGAFDEINSDKKNSRYCSFTLQVPLRNLHYQQSKN